MQGPQTGKCFKLNMESYMQGPQTGKCCKLNISSAVQYTGNRCKQHKHKQQYKFAAINIPQL